MKKIILLLIVSFNAFAAVEESRSILSSSNSINASATEYIILLCVQAEKPRACESLIDDAQLNAGIVDDDDEDIPIVERKGK